MIAPLLLCGAPGKVAILLDRSPDWASRQEETAGPCIEMLPRRSWLRRIVLAAALLFVLAAPAAAEEKAGGFSFAVDGRNDTEEAAAGPLYRSWATVGASFTVAGFKASALAGQYVYGFTGGAEGTAPMAVFAVRREIADVAKGTLSLDLSRTILWDAGERIDLTGARLGWTIKF